MLILKQINNTQHRKIKQKGLAKESIQLDKNANSPQHVLECDEERYVNEQLSTVESV